MVYDLRAYWLVYPPNLLKTRGSDGEERAKKDRCCLNCVILGSVMRYAALLCVPTRAVTMYGSFIEARPHKSFYLVLCSDVGLCFVWCFLSSSLSLHVLEHCRQCKNEGLHPGL